MSEARTAILSALAIAFACAAPARAADTAVTKCGKAVAWSEFDADDNGDKVVKYDATGIRKIAPVPRPGVHPRIFIGPEELPDLRRRLQGTRCGREVMLNIRAWSAHLNGTYDKEADYAKVPEEILGGAERLRGARVPLQRGRDVPKHYAQLVAGNAEGIETSLGSILTAVMAVEAFRCIVDEDEGGGRRLSKAMTALCEAKTPQVRTGDKARPDPNQVGVIGGHNMGYCYDFNFRYMNHRQRKVVRRAIAKAMTGIAHYGTFLPANAVTSNWCSLDTFLPMTGLAIEGEEGYDERYYKGCVRAFRAFLTYGWYASGAGYEGRGKNYQFNTTLIAFAKRGEDLVAHPHVRSYATSFNPHMMLPWGGGFVGYDDWGGTGWDSVKGGYRFNFNDALGLKWLFPDDPAVDFVWRNWVGEHYEHVPTRPEGYYNALVIAAVFASDWKPGKRDAAAMGLPNTFFCGERGLMVTRSDWSPDAVYLQLHCRQDLGGHTSAERNSFILCALGRIWGRLQTMAGGSRLGKSNETRFHSCITIDDVGQIQNASGSNMTPGRVVAFADAPLATFVCGDASEAYGYTWKSMGEDRSRWGEGWEPVTSTPNDFRFLKGTLAHLSKPWFEKDHWLRVGEPTRLCRRKWNPVRRAFRTAGVVRGAKPYVLMIDDIQKDDQPHHYKWMMQVSDDLELAPGRSGFGYDEKTGVGDVILCGRESKRDGNDVRRLEKGAPLLLVRVLECANPRELPNRAAAIATLEEYMSGIRWFGKGKRLVIPSWSVSPGYKVMLFPHRHGDKLPVTTWNKKRTEVTVVCGGQVDVFEFSVGDDGRTRFVLQRDGREAVSVK
jgi:hypothetical protein